ncbi:MAG: hypothetical protein ACP5HS_06780 [Anaerolineae bacterium]
MASLHDELRNRATSAFLQYALLRLESALVVAGTILLSVFLPHPFAWWPSWGWPLLGLVGWGTVVYASLTDPETSAKVLWQLLRERLDLQEIKDQTLRTRVATMTDYVRQAEADLYRTKGSPHRAALETAAEQMVDWTKQGALLARYADTYQRDHRLELRRQELPGLIETLVARLKYEKDPDIIERLNNEMEALGKDWESLKLLDAQMQQAESQLGQSLTAMARAASEFHLIAAEGGLAQDHVRRLNQEIERHLGQMTDLVSQVDALYTDALNKG